MLSCYWGLGAIKKERKDDATHRQHHPDGRTLEKSPRPICGYHLKETLKLQPPPTYLEEWNELNLLQLIIFHYEWLSWCHNGPHWNFSKIIVKIRLSATGWHRCGLKGGPAEAGCLWAYSFIFWPTNLSTDFPRYWFWPPTAGMMLPLWLLQRHRVSFQPSTTSWIVAAGLLCANPPMSTRSPLKGHWM